MPTLKRELIPGEIYHIYNRSAGKKTIFHSDQDYHRFLLKMVEYKSKFPIDILAYCLMPNHFHFLVRIVDQNQNQPEGSGSTPRVENVENARNSAQIFLHRLFTSYSKYYCLKYADNHSGHVFETSYKAKHVADDAYYLQLCGYIHDNPVRKKLVAKPEEWAFSSYPALIGVCNDEISCDAPELREGSHRQIYRDFAKSRQDIFDEIMQYV